MAREPGAPPSDLCERLSELSRSPWGAVSYEHGAQVEHRARCTRRSGAVRKNDPPKLHTVVSVALRLGVHPSKSMVERDLLGFLAATDRGDWTVGGRFPSIEEGLAKHVHAPLRSVEWALAALRKVGAIEATKKGYATKYSLTPGFRQRCIQVYEAYDWKRPDWGLLEDVLSQQWTATHCGPGPQPIAVASRDTDERTPNGVLSPKKRRTAEAARGLRPREGEPMSDHPTDDGFYGTKKAKREHESAALGEDPHKPLGPTKVVRGPDPRSKAVLAIQEYFRVKLTPFSERRKVPLFGQVGKMQKNIKFLLQQQHTPEAIEGAIDLFASQTESMYFQGESLWDMFFARRDEHIRLAAIHAIGSRGGPRESLVDKGRRLMAQQQQQKDVQ